MNSEAARVWLVLELVRKSAPPGLRTTRCEGFSGAAYFAWASATL